MSSFFRRIGRRPLGAAVAEDLLAGRGAATGAPAGQQALARVLEIAAGPPTDRELANEAAYVAAFVLATSPASTRRAVLPTVLRGLAQLTLAVMAAIVAVGGTAAFTGQLPARFQEFAHVTFGAPAPLQHVPRFPPDRQPNHGGAPAGLPIPGTRPAATATRPGKAEAAKPSPPAQTGIHPKIQPGGPHLEVRVGP
jgi:hypothetical protein